MSPEGPTHHGSDVGDLARAIRHLAPADDRTRRAIVTLLAGGAEGEPAPEPAPNRPGPTPTPPAESDRGPSSRTLPPPRRSEPADETEDRDHDMPFPISVTRSSAPAVAPPEWMTAARPFAPAVGAPSAPPPVPLFEPARSRGIFSAMMSTVRDGPTDLGAIVETVARGRPLARVPRRAVPTFARGVLLLTDRSDSMLPFLADVRGLALEVERLVGSAGVSVRSFVGCPTRGCGAGPRPRWTPFTPDLVPRAGTRVLCVTDLGLGRVPGGDLPASSGEWLEFARLVRLAGSVPAALTPYPRTRWPIELCRAIEIFQWDRTTSAAKAARGLGRRRP